MPPRFRLKAVLHALIVVMLVQCFSVHAQDARTMFKTFYEEGLRRTGIVGSSFMLIHGGKVVDRHFYGLANADEKRPIDEDTIYHWASITKTFTGIAIMQLRDRGRLKLDDPVIKYVPELGDVHNPHGSMSDITIRHLLSHSAGFRASTWPWGGNRDWHPHEPRSWNQLVAMMPYTEIEFRPGTRFSYSNPGIVFLGRIIERISADDYEVYIDKNIFKPLEMYRSYFDATPYTLLRHRAHSYTRIGETVKPGRFDVDTGITVSNGGLNSPFTDMAKYMSFLIGAPDDARRQATYDQVLKRTSLEEMWAPVVSIRDGKDRKEAMGLTFFIEDHSGRRFIGHSGHQNSFASHFYVEPARKAGYVVAYNTFAGTEKNPSEYTDKLDNEIRAFVFEKVFPGK